MSLRRHDATPSLRAWARARHLFGPRRRLGRLWSDGGQTGRGLHGTRATIPAAVTLAALVLVAGGLLLGPTLSGGVHPADQGDASEQALINRQAPSMAWAAALPMEIQRGLAAQEPVTALPALAWTRSYALTTADATLLANINASGSPTLAADTSIVADLAKLGHSFTGLETSVSDAVLVVPGEEAASKKEADDTLASTGQRATVRATVTTSSFAEHDAQGAVVHHHAEEQSQVLRIVLTRTDDRWVIEQILPVSTKK